MTDTKITPRGVRCNNPMNLRRTADHWLGLADIQADPAFFTFESPDYGIRAGVKILLTYFDKYRLDTVRSIINRFAPPTENDTGSYAFDVSKRLKVGMDTSLDLHDYATMLGLVRAIIAHECSNYEYPRDVLDRGLAMAGIGPAK